MNSSSKHRSVLVVLRDAAAEIRRRLAAEATTRETRIFGRVWYQILASSGGLPARSPSAV
jgi:hypothetical protein